jgi:hypothetical protein
MPTSGESTGRNVMACDYNDRIRSILHFRASSGISANPELQFQNQHAIIYIGNLLILRYSSEMIQILKGALRYV